MTRGPSSALRRHALRTAGIATLLVAAGLGAALTATDILVSNLLTGAVDHRLREPIDRVAAGRVPITDTTPHYDLDQPIFVWTVRDGRCLSAGAAPTLPPALCTVGGPTTATVEGTSFRILGRRLPELGRVVVGTSLAPVASLTGDLVRAELVVGPLLCVLVFAGALAIGSRVAGPVERMRQHQLAFTADASHELRTPLTVIQAEANLALTGTAPSLRPALVRVSEEVERMRHIVEDLLWLARFDSQPEPPTPVPLDLVTAAQLGAARFRPLARARSLQVAVDAPQKVVSVCAPVEWMDRLVGVLVDNACRHARSRVDLRVRAVPGRRAELAVTDDGEGVPEAELPRIFDRFHRATPQGEGAGLGLAIADSVVRGTRGRWEVTNRVGGGARFAIVWPLAGGEGATDEEPGPSRLLVRVMHPIRRRPARPPAH